MTPAQTIRQLEWLRHSVADEMPADAFFAGDQALSLQALDVAIAVLRSASVTPETRRSIQDDMNERLQLAVIKATHPDTGVSLDFVSLSVAQAVVSQAIGEILNQQTRLLDEERRRWYASLERVFGLSRNTLEGFAPEIAVTHLGLSPVSEATAPHEQKEKNDSGAGLIHQVASPTAETKPRLNRGFALWCETYASANGCTNGTIDGICVTANLPFREWCPECLVGHASKLLQEYADEIEAHAPSSSSGQEPRESSARRS